jgi:hypothetical protein
VPTRRNVSGLCLSPKRWQSNRKTVFRHCTNVRDGAIESTVESRIPDMTATPSTTPKRRRRGLQFSRRRVTYANFQANGSAVAIRLPLLLRALAGCYNAACGWANPAVELESCMTWHDPAVTQ